MLRVWRFLVYRMGRPGIQDAPIDDGPGSTADDVVAPCYLEPQNAKKPQSEWRRPKRNFVRFHELYHAPEATK